MVVSYDVFTEAFLDKITEYDFRKLFEADRNTIVDGYLKRSCAQFSKICKYDIGAGDDTERQFTFDGMTEDEMEEIVDIISEGMVLQWLKRFLFNQMNLRNILNSSDFAAYSPAELTYRITNAYAMHKRDFNNAMREYSYRHGDLTDLWI